VLVYITIIVVFLTAFFYTC